MSRLELQDQWLGSMGYHLRYTKWCIPVMREDYNTSGLLKVHFPYTTTRSNGTSKWGKIRSAQLNYPGILQVHGGKRVDLGTITTSHGPPPCTGTTCIARWCFQHICLFSPRNLGKIHHEPDIVYLDGLNTTNQIGLKYVCCFCLTRVRFQGHPKEPRFVGNIIVSVIRFFL